MPVHFIAEFVSSKVPSEYYATLGSAILATSLLKKWSSGQKLTDMQESYGKPLRDLHGRVVLVASGSFTPLGLVTLSSLAHRGAQIIALTPTLRSPRIHQLIALLRDSTNNELIYAEECDLQDLNSINTFSSKWNEGDPTTAGPSSGGKGGPRRIDVMLFMPSDEGPYSVGEGIKACEHPEVERTYGEEVLGRFHLINAILPSLLLLPPERDIRIVSVISPWYGAGVSSLTLLGAPLEPPQEEKKDGERSKAKMKRAYPLSTSEPWRIQGAAGLRWYALSRELQRRLQLLAEADHRPRDKLPGIDPIAIRPTATESIKKGDLKQVRRSNISVINVCTGFERNCDIISFLSPPAVDRDVHLLGKSADSDLHDAQDDHLKDPNPADFLKEALDPRLKERSTANGSVRVFAKLVTLVRYLVIVVLFPLIWLFCKSPTDSADSIIWSICKEMETESEIWHRLEANHKNDEDRNVSDSKMSKYREGLRQGELYREGRIIRPVLPKELLDRPEALSNLWKHEEARVESIIGSLRRPGKASG
ncbi:hypothetical protein IE53DRAFT_319872 [Violaceomyces palustris]|uniref:Uncharacterized protein n=1 Tax=Violaceomyces palustris TaxID=1673888 RepID=A0ACD0NQV7_9BASI|nr:hypothetical protein IE53DRAFT_319872 [Violaceomyces palustris]